MTVNQHTVTETEHKKRVDKILADVLHEYSRSQIRGWIEEGNVKLNGEAVKANQKCQTGESLTWEIPGNQTACFRAGKYSFRYCL